MKFDLELYYFSQQSLLILMKLNTIDDHTMNSTEANFMNNKKYADLRLQAGKKKVIPDKYV